MLVSSCSRIFSVRGIHVESMKCCKTSQVLVCPCGAETQTRNHILFECETYEEHGHLIDEGAPDHKLTTILGTKKGIDALAKFVRASKAFQKQEARPIP